jgi:hypothetical protein
MNIQETQKIREDRELATEIFDKFDEMEFNSISYFFQKIPAPDNSYLKWDLNTQNHFEKEHHLSMFEITRNAEQDRSGYSASRNERSGVLQ